MARLVLFAGAREAAGRAGDEIPASTLAGLLDVARERYGDEFAAVLEVASVWVNGAEPSAGRATPLDAGDEVAVLPPVSGGAITLGGRTREGRIRLDAAPGSQPAPLGSVVS